MLKSPCVASKSVDCFASGFFSCSCPDFIIQDAFGDWSSGIFPVFTMIAPWQRTCPFPLSYIFWKNFRQISCYSLQHQVSKKWRELLTLKRFNNQSFHPTIAMIVLSIIDWTSLVTIPWPIVINTQDFRKFARQIWTKLVFNKIRQLLVSAS